MDATTYKLNLHMNHRKLYQISVNNLKGFINANGDVVIEPLYHLVNEFCEGMAAVQIDEKYGFIDNTGEIIIGLKYDDADSFSEGKAGIALEQNWGFIDKFGETVINPQYKYVYPFQEGFAVVKMHDEQAFYTDERGQQTTKDGFVNADTFCEGRGSAFRKNEKIGFLDKTFKFVIPPQFDYMGHFSEGYASMVLNGKSVVIDVNGDIVQSLRWECGSFRDGLTWFCVDDKKYGVINLKGEIVVEPKFDSMPSFSEGLAAVFYKKKCGFINNQGQWVIDPQYNGAYNFDGGLAEVKIGDNYGYIDYGGDFVWKPTF